MSEYVTSLLVIFSEVGVVLALAAIGLVIYLARRKHKDNSLARYFVENLHEGESARQGKLVEVLEKVHEMDHELAVKTAQTMLGCEKQIYNRALKLFLRHDRDSLSSLRKDVENMASAYGKLVEKVEAPQVIERGENPKMQAHYRSQIKQLEAERDKLQRDLDEAMHSMENMLKEYTQMYSGGGARKEGVKHIENELSTLKQKIEKNLVEVRDDDEEDTASESGDVPDLSPPKTDQN